MSEKSLEERVQQLESALAFYKPYFDECFVSPQGYSNDWKKTVDKSLHQLQEWINHLRMRNMTVR